MSDSLPPSSKDTIRKDLSEQAANERQGKLTIYTCPQCGGTLWQEEGGETLTFACHVGHRCSAEELLTEKAQEGTYALWRTLRTRVEQATLLRQMARQARENPSPSASAQFEEVMAARLETQAETIEKENDQLRQLLETISAEATREEPLKANP